MRFADLTTAFQAMQGVCGTEQDAVRQLWRDAIGDAFVDEVLAGHRAKLVQLAEAASAADQRQQSNEKARQESSRLVSEARARDGALDARLEQLLADSAELQAKGGKVLAALGALDSRVGGTGQTDVPDHGNLQMRANAVERPLHLFQQERLQLERLVQELQAQCAALEAEIPV